MDVSIDPARGERLAEVDEEGNLLLEQRSLRREIIVGRTGWQERADVKEIAGVQSAVLMEDRERAVPA